MIAAINPALIKAKEKMSIIKITYHHVRMAVVIIDEHPRAIDRPQVLFGQHLHRGTESAKTAV